jgi:glycosyltransferase 2 family protein
VKKFIITLLKVSVSLAIIVFMVWKATSGEANQNAFAKLSSGPIVWPMFAAAVGIYLVAVLLTFVRWWFLVRALDVPLRLGDSIRISFWGYLLNMSPFGIVGGDLGKTLILAHEQPNYRAKALASVMADRVIGLYILFVVVTAAILLTGFANIDNKDIHRICLGTYIITAVSTLGLLAVMGPDISHGKILDAIRRFPKVGHHLANLIEAIRLYNTKPMVMLVSCIMSVGVHCLIALSCYCIACGLPGNRLSLANHFVVIPMSNATGVIPLPFGPFEAVLDMLYQCVPTANGQPIAAGQGLVVAFAYRLVTAMILLFGLPYYFGGSRREISDVMHEAEATPEPDV